MSLDGEILNWVRLAKGGPGSGRTPEAEAYRHKDLADWHKEQYEFHKKAAEGANKQYKHLLRHPVDHTTPAYREHIHQLADLRTLQTKHSLAANAHATAFRMHSVAATGQQPAVRFVQTESEIGEIPQFEDVRTPEEASKIAGQLTNLTELALAKGGPGSGPRPKGASLELQHRQAQRYHERMNDYHRAQHDAAWERGDREAAMAHRRAAYAHMDAKFVHMEVADRLKRGENVTPNDRQEAWDHSDAASAHTERISAREPRAA